MANISRRDVLKGLGLAAALTPFGGCAAPKLPEARSLPPFQHGAFGGRIGVGRADMTPPVGIYARSWGAAKHDVAAGIHRPITATAISLQSRSGEKPLLLMGIDLGGSRRLEDEWYVRGGLIETLGLDRSRVMINFSHTHAGPSTCPADRDKPGGHLIGSYLAKVREAVIKAGRAALDSAAPATLDWTTGRCSLAVNRDLRDPDAERMICGYNPGAPADDTVLVGRVADGTGKIRATIVNYACHPTTLAYQNTLISPDFIGGLREIVQANTGGAPCLYLHGASGELSPLEQYSGDTALADRNGRQIGFAALSALEGMLPPGTRLEYAGVVESGAPLGTWKRAKRNVSSTLTAVRREVELPVKDIPPRAELRKMMDAEPDRVMKERLRRKMRIRQKIGDGRSYPVPLWVWRVGDAFLVGQPNESYSRLQTELRRRYPKHPVVVMNLVNGSFGYLPPRDLYHLDLYQVWQTPWDRGSLKKVIDSASRAISELGGA